MHSTLNPLIMIVVVIAALFVLALLYALWTLATEVFKAVQSGAAKADHWSPHSERLEVPSAPFRDAPLNHITQRGAPLWLRFASGLGVGAGVLTSSLVAPIALVCVLGHHGLPDVSTGLAALVSSPWDRTDESDSRALKAKRAPSLSWDGHFARWP